MPLAVLAHAKSSTSSDLEPKLIFQQYQDLVVLVVDSLTVHAIVDEECWP